MEGVETEGEKYQEWTSSDGKHKVIYMIRGGGKEWGGVWLKEIILKSTDPLTGSEMMKVQIVKNPDEVQPTKVVYVDTFRVNSGFGEMVKYVYSSDSEGLREETGEVSMKDEAEPLDYIESLTTSEVRLVQDLPKRIDVEETIRLFQEQLIEQHFYMPVLIGVE